MFSLSRQSIFALLLFLPSLTFAQTQVQNLMPTIFGIPARPENGGTNVDNLNAAASWQGRGFFVSEAKTLSKVQFYCDSKTGTPAGSDIRVSLYAASTSNGQPAAATTEDRTLTNTTCAGWLEATGFTTALSANTQYYIVIRNLHATPASNYISIRRTGVELFAPGYSAGLATSWGWNKAFTSDSGATWATGNSSGAWAGLRLEFSDGTFAGLPFSERTKEGTEAYSTREVGAYFVVPADGPSLRVRGAGMVLSWTGTAPSAGLEFRIRTGSTPGSPTTSATIPDESVTAAGSVFHNAYFSSVLTLAPGTIVRLTIHAVSDGGSGGNAYQTNRYTVDNSAGSLTLYPYSARMTSYNGSAWTEDTTKIIPFILLLDTADPYDVAAASSGPKQNTPGSGGMQ